MQEEPAADSDLYWGVVHLLVEARGLQNIRCEACDGFGHTQRKCPTLPRLR